MEAATQDNAKPARKKRPPLEGQELLDKVADLVVQGYQAMSIARKCSITIAAAEKLREEIFERTYRATEATYTPEGLKRLKHSLTQGLLQQIDDARDEVRQSRRNGQLNTRAYARSATAAKLVAQMHGLNAPTQVVNTDIRVYAAVQAKDMDRVLADKRARAAMLEFEEAVTDLNAAEAAPVIDVTPADAEGGGA